MEDNIISDYKDNIKPFYAIKIFEKGKELDPNNKDNSFVSWGPSASLPRVILEKIGKKIIKKNWLYRVNRIIRTKKKIVKHYKTRYKINISLNQVVTSGASASILLVLMTSFKAGDTVAIVSPGYPCYLNILKSLRLKVYNIQTTIEKGFQLDISQIANLPSYVKGIILASPSNPTGVTINRNLLEELIKFV